VELNCQKRTRKDTSDQRNPRASSTFCTKEMEITGVGKKEALFPGARRKEESSLYGSWCGRSGESIGQQGSPAPSRDYKIENTVTRRTAKT